MTDQLLQLNNGIAAYRPEGEVTLEQAIDLIKVAIESARAMGLRKLLLDITRLRGFTSPHDGARHYLSRKWAGAAGGVMHLAVVARPEMLDPEKFGIVVARNFGASADAFTSEAEAVRWLEKKAETPTALRG